MVLLWQGNICEALLERYLHQDCLQAILHGSTAKRKSQTPGLLSRDNLLTMPSCPVVPLNTSQAAKLA